MRHSPYIRRYTALGDGDYSEDGGGDRLRGSFAAPILRERCNFSTKHRPNVCISDSEGIVLFTLSCVEGSLSKDLKGIFISF